MRKSVKQNQIAEVFERHWNRFLAHVPIGTLLSRKSRANVALRLHLVDLKTDE